MMHPTRGETTKYGTDRGQPDIEQRRRAHQELGNEEDDGMSFADGASLGNDSDIGSGRARNGRNSETSGGRMRDGSDGDMEDGDGERRNGEEGKGESQVGGIELHRRGGGDEGEGNMGLERGGRGQGRGGRALGGGTREHGDDIIIEPLSGRAIEGAGATADACGHEQGDPVAFEESGRGGEFEGDIDMRRQPGRPIRPEGDEHDDGFQESEASYVGHRGRYIAQSTPTGSVHGNQHYGVVAYNTPASASPNNPFHHPRAHAGPNNTPSPISTKPPYTSLRTAIDIKTYAYPDLLNAMAGYLHCPPSDVVFDVRGAMRRPDFSIAAFMRE